MSFFVKMHPSPLKFTLVVSFHVSVHISTLGIRNKILIPFIQECLDCLRKYRLFKGTFDHEINNCVVGQNYHNKILKINYTLIRV
jgi:hypothetical protein